METMIHDINSILEFNNLRPVLPSHDCKHNNLFYLEFAAFDWFLKISCVIFQQTFCDRNSYGYQIQEPTEPKVDDTKYKYDYTLQQPMDEKMAEPPKPTLNTKVDRVIQDKPGNWN